MNAYKVAGIGIGLFILVAIIVLGPLALLWALNTLFPALSIPFTFWTWLGAFLLSAPFVNRKG